MHTPISPISDRLHGRRFAVANNTQGLSGAGTVFYYQVDGEAISGTTRVAGFAPVSRWGA